jgi:LysM repeat protein
MPITLENTWKATTLFVVLLSFVGFVGLMPANAQEIDIEGSVHVIQPGENLFRIALSYGLTTDQIAAANGITNPTRIFVGQTLVIPTENTLHASQESNTAAPPVPEEAIIIAPESPAASVEVAAAIPEPVTRPVYHTVQRGETLREIAQTHGVAEEELIRQNDLTNPNRILVGQELLIRNEPVPVAESAPAAPEAETDAPASTITHTVQAGEHLSAIARQYNVSNDAITAANTIINPNQLYAGQQLIIPNGTAVETAAPASIQPEPGAKINSGREIVVDLSNSRVYAYENGILLYEALGSTGLPATPTVQGNFTVQSKIRSQTMSGPGYWLPNVEWVLYFYKDYALHGTYWHNSFGQPMSHGCVNLTNQDAQWLFSFADIGTPVTVQY